MMENKRLMSAQELGRRVVAINKVLTATYGEYLIRDKFVALLTTEGVRSANRLVTYLLAEGYLEKGEMLEGSKHLYKSAGKQMRGGAMRAFYSGLNAGNKADEEEEVLCVTVLRKYSDKSLVDELRMRGYEVKASKTIEL